jgi:MarR family transcriptional regulator, 2-MHQ and catechol-resistance regulon repressor
VPKSTSSELITSVSETDDRIELWIRISDAWKRLTRRAEENLSKMDLSLPDFRILKTLEKSGASPMAHLAHQTMLTQAAITVIVDELEGRKLVERIRSEQDRRVINIEITPRGSSLVKEAIRMHRRFVDEVLNTLTAEELVNLAALMSKLAPKTQ